MKNLATVLIFISIFVVGCEFGDNGGGSSSGGDDLVPGAGAEDYTARAYESEFKLWEAGEERYADANKDYEGDSKLCWAAVAANLITWSGWAADEDDVFDIFRGHFRNEPGYVYDALRYFFDNYVHGTKAEMVTVRETRSRKLLDFIVSALHESKGVAVKIEKPGKKTGHFLSVFGYRYLEEEDNFILYFTDSDDRAYRIRQFYAGWNDDEERWEFQNLYEDYYLEYVISVARK